MGHESYEFSPLGLGPRPIERIVTVETECSWRISRWKGWYWMTICQTWMSKDETGTSMCTFESVRDVIEGKFSEIKCEWWRNSYMTIFCMDKGIWDTIVPLFLSNSVYIQLFSLFMETDAVWLFHSVLIHLFIILHDPFWASDDVRGQLITWWQLSCRHEFAASHIALL